MFSHEYTEIMGLGNNITDVIYPSHVSCHWVPKANYSDIHLDRLVKVMPVSSLNGKVIIFAFL